MSEKKVSAAVIRRLPRYFRYLGELLNQGIDRISSNELSERMGVTASQIRQDLNCFGGFGQQGFGYQVDFLYNEIGNILGVYNGYTVIIIGAGNLGRALANYRFFNREGYKIIGIFDNAQEVVGETIKDLTVLHVDALEQFMGQQQADIAILAIPRDTVPDIAEKLVKYGIKGLWNYSFAELSFDEPVAVENVHLSDSLMTLSYKVAQLEK
ncbi:MAG: redox-sensing transcriptional repressor Rex [Hyphomonadaceae bacterium]|nr:redox-sensing transcriptional repressor Rex [Clostridia bacterium]